MCEHWAGKHGDKDACYQLARQVGDDALVPVCICCVNVAAFGPRYQPDISLADPPQNEDAEL